MTESSDSGLSPDAVTWAYRLFLDREPESEEAVESKLLFLNTTEELRAHFMACEEFQQKYSARVTPRSEDGLPLPPPQLIFLVAGHSDPTWFLAGGKMGAESIRTALEQNGLSLADFGSVLDFGCGCGRVMRHWQSVAGPSFFGTDYNPDLVDWCSNNIPYARFSVNDLWPPLDYKDSSFDFIYALSVFTHLPEDLQRPWVEEMARVLTPGGVLLLTVHGSHYLKELSSEEQESFLQGELVVREIEQAGSNVCGAYHPSSYLRRGAFGEYFEMIDHIERGAKGNPFQDIVLLTKRG